MRRLAAVLAATALATALATGLGIATAPGASACASQPCQWFCDTWELSGRSCPIRVN